MIQTVESPLVDIEKNREHEVVEKWESLEDTDKIMIKTQFVSELRFEYHKPFFQRMSLDSIIRERWFHQYVEQLYFSRDEFSRKKIT